MKINDPLKLALIFFAASFVALIAVPLPVKSTGLFGASGSYAPLIASVLLAFKSEFLPKGWQLLGISSAQRIDLYIISAASLALILDYPIIAYLLLKPIVPQGEWKTVKTTVFTSISSVLFLVGAFLAPPTVIRLITSNSVGGPPPILNEWDFYRVIFQLILIGGVTLSSPVCLCACLLQARRRYAQPRTMGQVE